MRGTITTDGKYAVVIVDAMNVAHRFFNSMKFLRTGTGHGTGVIFGTLRMLLKFKREYGRSTYIFAWDFPRLKRKQVYKDYKANRARAGQDFWKQVATLKELLAKLNVRQYYSEGNEADDVIAKLVKRNRDKKTLIISNDTDMYQLIGRNTSLLSRATVNGKKTYQVVDVTKLAELTGLTPKQYLYWKIVRGDKKTDNVPPAVKNIPEEVLRKMVKALNRFSDIFELTSSDERVQRWIKKVHEHREDLVRNYRLISLRRRKKIRLRKIPRDRNKEEACEIIKRLEMFSLLKDIGKFV